MFGIDDIIFIVFTSIITDTLAMAFSHMPTMVLMAKITPSHIEATVFAILTGISNFSSFVISPLVGVIINRLFVNVTAQNLDDYYILVFI